MVHLSFCITMLCCLVCYRKWTLVFPKCHDILFRIKRLLIFLITKYYYFRKICYSDKVGYENFIYQMLIKTKKKLGVFLKMSYFVLGKDPTWLWTVFHITKNLFAWCWWSFSLKNTNSSKIVFPLYLFLPNLLINRVDQAFLVE